MEGSYVHPSPGVIRIYSSYQSFSTTWDIRISSGRIGPISLVLCSCFWFNLRVQCLVLLPYSYSFDRQRSVYSYVYVETYIHKCIIKSMLCPKTYPIDPKYLSLSGKTQDSPSSM